MNPDIRTSMLTQARRRLVTMMQQIHFGRIEDLIIVAGEPVLNPAPRVVREIKFGSCDDARRDPAKEYALKAPVVQMLDALTQLHTGRVELLEIKHGLPHRMNVETRSAEGGCAVH